MTTANTSASSKTPQAPKVRQRFRLPDIPEREPDEVTQFDHIAKTGNAHYLAQHLGHPETTLVEADRWIAPDADFDKRRARYPDLLVAFGVDPAAYRASNGYVVEEQGKPPDFVLEVASESTGDHDVGDKRDYYESLGILEYWRFDETGEHHGTRLAGDLLANGRYEPIDIEELPGGVLQGYSRSLELYLRWEEGWLVFRDPATGEPIATLESERRGRVQAEARADAERELRVQAEARADTQRQARETAEARVRELEERYGERPSGEQT